MQLLYSTTVILLTLLAVLAAVGLAAPADCTDQTFTTAQTITFNPSETNLMVKLTRCKYNAGLTITYGEPFAGCYIRHD